jgi:muramidase (phage lysozyme)
LGRVLGNQDVLLPLLRHQPPHPFRRRPDRLSRPTPLSHTAAQPFLASLLLILPLAAPPPGHQQRGVSPQLALSQPVEPPQAYRLTPERRALLSTIRYAEGTWLGGSREGYRVLYGGGRFAGFERHPEIEIRRRYVSAAAGAYQFLPKTWKAAAGELGLPDFGPTSQDQAALHLVRKRGVLHIFDREGLSAGVLAHLAQEWASLPSSNGDSFYGQPVRSVSELQAFFRRELERQRSLQAA